MSSSSISNVRPIFTVGTQFLFFPSGSCQSDICKWQLPGLLAAIDQSPKAHICLFQMHTSNIVDWQFDCEWWSGKDTEGNVHGLFLAEYYPIIYMAELRKTTKPHGNDCLLGSCAFFIALMMEAVSTPESSVNFYQTTRHNILQDSHLHMRCHENLESHLQNLSLDTRSPARGSNPVSPEHEAEMSTSTSLHLVWKIAMEKLPIGNGNYSH
jgi:hypothetical protein